MLHLLPKLSVILLLIILISIPLVISTCNLSQLLISLGCGWVAQICGGLDLSQLSLIKNYMTLSTVLMGVLILFYLIRFRLVKHLALIDFGQVIKFYIFSIYNQLFIFKLNQRIIVSLSKGLLNPKSF